jgi:predicted aspartyl protease
VDGIIDGTAATMLVDTGADTTYLTLTGTEKRGLLLR